MSCACITPSLLFSMLYHPSICSYLTVNMRDEKEKASKEKAVSGE